MANRRKHFDVMAKLGTYKRPEVTDGLPDQVAHFLDWAAREMPLFPIPWNLVFKYIHGHNRTPTLKSEDVIGLRKRSTDIREKLMKKYNRGLASVPGQGVCATSGSDHLANTQLRSNYNRLVGAQRSFDKTMNLVKPKEMQDPQLKSWVERTNRALSDMGLSERLTKLLPPGAEPGKKEEKK